MAFLATFASANIVINSKDAKEVIQSRQKRANLGKWGSNLEKECFENNVCRAFEEFKEGAENIYGKPLIRKDKRTEHAYTNLYKNCHKNTQFCSNDGNDCQCNVQFKNWLEKPSDETAECKELGKDRMTRHRKDRINWERQKPSYADAQQ